MPLKIDAPQQQAPPGAVDPPPQPCSAEEPHQHQGEAAVHEIAGRGLPELQLPRLQPRRQRMRAERAGDHREGAAEGAEDDPVHGRSHGASPGQTSPSRRTEAILSRRDHQVVVLLPEAELGDAADVVLLGAPAVAVAVDVGLMRKMPRSSMSSHRPTTISGPVVSTITVMPCSSPLF